MSLGKYKLALSKLKSAIELQKEKFDLSVKSIPVPPNVSSRRSNMLLKINECLNELNNAIVDLETEIANEPAKNLSIRKLTSTKNPVYNSVGTVVNWSVIQHISESTSVSEQKVNDHRKLLSEATEPVAEINIKLGDIV